MSLILDSNISVTVFHVCVIGHSVHGTIVCVDVMANLVPLTFARRGEQGMIEKGRAVQRGLEVRVWLAILIIIY